jgi:hypothetical protein
MISVAYSTPLQNNRQDKDLEKIEKLHDFAWEERQKGRYETSETIFRDAEIELQKYRRKYVRDRSSLSFLRATFRLGYLSELANKDKDARGFYEACLEHPLIDSTLAMADGYPVSELARVRLKIVIERLRDRSKVSRGDYPRISIRGGSKGARDLPDRSSDVRP